MLLIHHPTLHSSWLGAYCLVGVDDGRVWPIARKMSRLGLVIASDDWWWLLVTYGTNQSLCATNVWHVHQFHCWMWGKHDLMYYTNVWCIGTCAQSMHSITVECMESTNVLHWHMVLTHSSNLLYIEYTGTPISIYLWHKSMYPSCAIELWHHWSRAQMHCIVQLACLYIHALFNRHHKRFDSAWMAPHTQKSTTLDLIPWWFTSPALQRLKLCVDKTILSDRSASFVFFSLLILTALE